MHRVFRSDWYRKKLEKLDNQEQERVKKFEQSLKEAPYSGKPLGYEFLREKKFGGKRILFLIYEAHQTIFLVTITDKKAQQEETAGERQVTAGHAPQAARTGISIKFMRLIRC